MNESFPHLAETLTYRVSPPAPYRPNVEVIVPGYNEEPALLAACLRSLCQQEDEGEVRVWVVDDGSDNRDDDDQTWSRAAPPRSSRRSTSSTRAPAPPGRSPC